MASRRRIDAQRPFGHGRTFLFSLLRRRLAEWTADHDYDAIVVVCSSMVQYLDCMQRGNATVLVDLIDVDSQKWFDYADSAAGLPRLLYRLEGRRVRRLEAELPGLCDCICVVSEAETRCYRDFQPLANVTAIPNGVDGEYFHPNVGQTPTPNSCVFVGALDYKPNIDAVQWFCQSVWPHVLMSHPRAIFTIVGRRPGENLRRLHGQPGVRVVADAADVRPFLWDAAVAVAPLRIARGVQNKVLEAMAAGRPVLATPQALNGLSDDAKTAVFVATTDIESRNALRRLFADESIRERPGRLVAAMRRNMLAGTTPCMDWRDSYRRKELPWEHQVSNAMTRGRA